MALSDNIRGAGLMVAAMSAFTFNDVCIKLLAGVVPLGQVIVVRSLIVCGVIGLVGWRLGTLRFRLSRSDWRYLALRCGAEGCAAYFFLTALFHMDISTLSAILQALPLTVTLGAALFFAEPVGWRRFLAIGVGFLGVMLIIRPGTEDFSSYALFGVATVLCATIRDLATRRLSKDVTSLTAALITAAVVTGLGAGLSLGGEAWAVLDPRAWLLLVAAAILICLAYLTIVMTMRVGDVGFVAPFRYTSLVVAVVSGMIVFGERPDLLTVTGGLIVVGSGLFTLWREQRLAKHAGQGTTGP